MVKKYLPSYGERANDAGTVVKCEFHVSDCVPSVANRFVDLREKFKEILKQHSPEQRSSYFYATSVVVSIRYVSHHHFLTIHRISCAL